VLDFCVSRRLNHPFLFLLFFFFSRLFPLLKGSLLFTNCALLARFFALFLLLLHGIARRWWTCFSSSTTLLELLQIRVALSLFPFAS
jgi:hypothetical protein